MIVDRTPYFRQWKLQEVSLIPTRFFYIFRQCWLTLRNYPGQGTHAETTVGVYEVCSQDSLYRRAAPGNLVS